MRKKTHEALLAEERLRALAAERERDQLRAIVERPAQVVDVSDCLASYHEPMPRVRVTSGFTVGNKFKCAGAVGHLPFNPFPIENAPTFLVNFNGDQFEVRLVEAAPHSGWVGEGVETLEAADDAALNPYPRVKLDRASAAE